VCFEAEMYIETTRKINKIGKQVVKHLLRESYREGKKVKKRTIANLSSYSESEIVLVKQILSVKRNKKGKNTDYLLGDIKTEQGYSIGAFYLLSELLSDLGIVKALGKSRNGTLAIFQIIFRIIHQASRASSIRLANSYPVKEVLGLEDIKLAELYNNLEWLYENQERIEKLLFDFKYKDGEVPENIYLYDITSSYFEGTENELSAFGYNRDKKKGKKQIVIGALTDQNGYLISIKVFKGNTLDFKTVSEQLNDIENRFNGVSITFVGDRGMIKSAQIEDAYNHNFHYITGISKPQLEKLVRDGVIEKSLFNLTLSEVTTDNIRYVLKLNPVLKQSARKSRNERYEKLEKLLDTKNEYLIEHKRAKVDIAAKNVLKYAQKLKISTWIEIKEDSKNRKLILIKNEKILKEKEEFDGCYVLKTDLIDKTITKEIIHERYKSLQKVERVFRTIKTTHLDIRPIHLRKENRTRGHVFIAMISFIVVQELDKRWKKLEYTAKEGIAILDRFSFIDIYAKEKYLYSELPTPNKETKELLEKANISIPNRL
jgi:transposase